MELLLFILEGKYHPVPIALVVTLLYTASWLLSKNNKIPVVLHRKIWNLFLLASFILVAALATLLILAINYGIRSPLPLDSRFWHVEIGIAMVLVAAFHILWHLSYFKAYLPQKKDEEKE